LPCRGASGSGAFDFTRKLLDQVGVSRRIDFTLQQAGCAGDGETADVLAQRVTGTRLLQRDFLLGVTDEPLAFRNGSATRFIDDLGRTLVRLVDDLLRLLTSSSQDALGFPVGALQLCWPRSAAARPSAIFFCRSPTAFDQRRPDELDREPDQDPENQSPGRAASH
jgi:hypothetical protein